MGRLFRSSLYCVAPKIFLITYLRSLVVLNEYPVLSKIMVFSDPVLCIRSLYSVNHELSMAIVLSQPWTVCHCTQWTMNCLRSLYSVNHELCLRSLYSVNPELSMTIVLSEPWTVYGHCTQWTMNFLCHYTQWTMNCG